MASVGTDSEEITGFYECRSCRYRITELTFESAKFNYLCPRCFAQVLSQFIHYPGESAA